MKVQFDLKEIGYGDFLSLFTHLHNIEIQILSIFTVTDQSITKDFENI